MFACMHAHVHMKTCCTQNVQVGSFYLNQRLLRQLLVDLWSVGDVLGTVGIVQSGEGLLNVALSRRNGGYDGSLGATTKRVLKDTSQLTLPEQEGQTLHRPHTPPLSLGLPVRYMGSVLHQSSDDSAKSEETLVDVSCLPSSLVHSS